MLFVFAPAIADATGVFVPTTVARSGGKTAAATEMAGAKKNNNQLKAVAAIVMETATMTATSTTIKMKASALQDIDKGVIAVF